MLLWILLNAASKNKTNIMAEFILRNKKANPRVDLTPMVDLGFLLITFFIITTAMRKPTAMKFDTPLDGEDATTAESKTLTLVLSGKNQIFYYQGVDSLHQKSCSYDDANGVRKIIIQKLLDVEKRFGKKSETVILIKPTAQSCYKNIVDVMDEMLINNVKRYMIINAKE